MLFVVLFTDALDAPRDVRTTHMAAHLNFLAKHADRVQAAGPLSDPDHAGRDGLWIVEASDPEAVEALIREDPFWHTGLRGGHTILPWRRVFPQP